MMPSPPPKKEPVIVDYLAQRRNKKNRDGSEFSDDRSTKSKPYKNWKSIQPEPAEHRAGSSGRKPQSKEDGRINEI